MDEQDGQDGDRICTLTLAISRRGRGEFTLTLALCHRGRGDIMGGGLGLDATFDCERLHLNSYKGNPGLTIGSALD